MSDQNHPGDEPVADADLVLRTRSGDRAAFGELWRRHYPSGIAVARSLTSGIDADDLVQESYTRIYNAILRGGGPNGSFRAYLFTSIRNTAAAWGKARRETAIDEMEAVADPASTDAAAEEALDRGLTAQAFRSLPSRWQEVLWYTEIEQMKPAAVAPLLGMKPGAVAQLAFRAREGLREAWIQAHLRSAGEGSECAWTIERLGAYARGNLGVRDRERVDRHLEGCARCMIVAGEAQDVSQRLALVLLPLVLGVTGAAGYLATIQGGGAPIVAMAMPAGVAGATVDGVGKAAGAFAATGPGGTASGAGAGSGGAGTGAVTGIGALVGAGSAALVVAGVVAAATVIPGLSSAPMATSLPSASDSPDSSGSIPIEVEPDETLDLTEDSVLVLEEPAPPSDDAVDPPADDAPVVPESPVDVVDEEAGAGVPVTDGRQDEPETARPTPDPQPEPEPVPEPEPEPEPEPQPEPGDPGTENPGDGESGGDDSGDDAPDEEEPPAAPSAEVEIVSCEVTWPSFSDEKTYVRITVRGVPGNTVRAWIGSTGNVGSEAVLDENGLGELELRPKLEHILSARRTNVVTEYVIDDGSAFARTDSLHSLMFCPQ